MPVVSQLKCSVEWANSRVAFEEFGTTYNRDGVVCYIAVPSSRTAFSIRLQNTGYMTSGLSMFVFIDGRYQCNRNKVTSKLTEDVINQELDLFVDSREEKLQSGEYLAREWSFVMLDTRKS